MFYSKKYTVFETVYTPIYHQKSFINKNYIYFINESDYKDTINIFEIKNKRLIRNNDIVIDKKIYALEGYNLYNIQDDNYIYFNKVSNQVVILNYIDKFNLVANYNLSNLFDDITVSNEEKNFKSNFLSYSNSVLCISDNVYNSKIYTIDKNYNKKSIDGLTFNNLVTSTHDSYLTVLYKVLDLFYLRNYYIPYIQSKEYNSWILEQIEEKSEYSNETFFSFSIHLDLENNTFKLDNSKILFDDSYLYVLDNKYLRIFNFDANSSKEINKIKIRHKIFDEYDYSKLFLCTDENNNPVIYDSLNKKLYFFSKDDLI